MKKTLRVLVLAVAMLMLATLIVGCKPATQATTYTVTFDADGGAPVPAAQKVRSGEKATKPTEPTKTDFTFAGWYLGDKEYTFQEAVTSDITLKAKWTPVSTKPETATTEEVTYTTTIRGGDVTIKVALEYEKQSHKIVDVLLADDNVYCTSNWTDKWQAGAETAVASYIGMTLEEVVALEAATGNGVVTGATLSSNALLEAVKMAANTVVKTEVESDVNVTLPELQEGYAYLVIYEPDDKPCTVYAVELAKLENQTVITMLEYLNTNESMHLVAGTGQYGAYVNEIGNIKSDDATSTYLYFYTSVAKDADTSAYAQSIMVGGIQLTSSGVGTGEMSLESQCVIYVGLIKY